MEQKERSKLEFVSLTFLVLCTWVEFFNFWRACTSWPRFPWDHYRVPKHNSGERKIWYSKQQKVQEALFAQKQYRPVASVTEIYCRRDLPNGCIFGKLWRNTSQYNLFTQIYKAKMLLLARPRAFEEDISGLLHNVDFGWILAVWESCCWSRCVTNFLKKIFARLVPRGHGAWYPWW